MPVSAAGETVGSKGSLMIIAVDVVALYALCAYGSRANLQAAA